MLDNVDFSPCYSWLMTNIYLEVRLSVFSYLMQHLAGSSVIQLTMRGVFFFFPLYDILILSQLCKLNSCVILLLSIKNHQFQILTVTHMFIQPCIFLFMTTRSSKNYKIPQVRD